MLFRSYAEDYAHLVFGLLELFQADPRTEWLEWAVELQRRQDELFWDAEAGGWFSTTGQDPTVLLRMKEEHDGAEPAASSISVMNLVLLSHLCGTSDWAARIEQTLRLFGPRLESSGHVVPMMAAAFATWSAGIQQVVVVGGGPGARELEREAMAAYRPFTLVLALKPEVQPQLAGLMPLVASMHPVDGRAAAYVCRDFACRAPVTAAGVLARELSSH